MARWEFKLPDIGEGVTEGEVVAWHIKPGDLVKEDAPMIDIMTDKATVTIASPKNGRVLETRGAIGEVVAVHGVLVVLELDAASAEPQAPLSHDAGSPRHMAGHEMAGHEMARHETAQGASLDSKPLATPATRKFARDLDVDLRQVPPTGAQGRITKVDVMQFVETARAEAPRAHSGATPVASTFSNDAVRIAPATGTHRVLEERIPFAGMRRKIAQRMAQSKRTAAHFTFVEECDVTALRALRGRLRPQAEGQHVKLTFLPFIVKACVAALKKHPILNSALDEVSNEIVLRKYYNIGIATSTEAGLVVPSVKDADRLSLLEVGREIERLATDAKNGKAKVDDLQGSTFTITSLGVDGGLFATPIINFPEVAILGVHRMKEKPVVREGQIVVGEVMLLSLSFDHRIVDGHVGAAFAYDLISYLENPDRLFLEMA